MGKSKHRVIWCDRGWQPVYFGFCPSEKAWHRQMETFSATDEPYPDSDGRCTFFTKDGKVSCIVTIRDGTEAARSTVEIAGLLVHEAAHVWQEVRKAMQEKEPSIEFEAYSMQAIFQELYSAFMDTRGKGK